MTGDQPRFVITGGATAAEVAAVVTVLSAATTATAAAGSGPAAAAPDGRTPRELWAASLGPGLRSAITWRTSTWW